MGITLLTGDDESILRTAVNDLVNTLVGDGDRSMMLDEFDDDEYELRLVVDAAQTPPFLTDKRVVVARGVGRFNTADLGPLTAYLDNPLDSTDLVLVGGGGTLAKKLSDHVKKVGELVSTAAPKRAKDRQAWLKDYLATAGLSLDGAATQRLGDWLGEDAGRIEGLVATLKGALGGTAGKLGWPDIEPFLGEAGGVPPWEFTDAIESGNTTQALTLLGRMIHGGGRHPLQLMATLHNHYANLARLDGVDARTEQDAMAATGMKSAFPAKKALASYRRLGGEQVRRAYDLLATADRDLRGDRDLDPVLVMEVLVARLSKLRR